MVSSPDRVDPRISRSRRAILDAALVELAERGYGAFTIDGVATRSGVARSTIYRLWRDRPSLIAAAIDELNTQPPPRPPGDETPRQRITVLLRHLTEAMQHSMVARCMPALIDGAERDPAIRDLYFGYSDRRRSALVAAVGAAIAAGEVRDGVDPEMAAVALAGAIVYRRLATPAPLQPGDVDLLVDTVLGPPPRG